MPERSGAADSTYIEKIFSQQSRGSSTQCVGFFGRTILRGRCVARALVYARTGEVRAGGAGARARARGSEEGEVLAIVNGPTMARRERYEAELGDARANRATRGACF